MGKKRKKETTPDIIFDENGYIIWKAPCVDIVPKSPLTLEELREKIERDYKHYKGSDEITEWPDV